MPSTRDPRLVIEQLRQLVEAWEDEKRISVGTLCTLLAIRPRTLHHYCVRHLGISPLQMVLRIRLDRVRHALLTGEGNVTSIAFAHGFTSLGYFSGLYRRVFGESPRDTLRSMSASAYPQDPEHEPRRPSPAT
jgi:transcriptional regulator GlxA family with amidase domain